MQQDRRWLRHLKPKRLADLANRQFVGLAQSFMRLISWNHPVRQTNSTELHHQSPGQGGKGRQRLETADFEIKGDARVSGTQAEAFQRKMKDLFHHDTQRRQTATQWIRHNRIAGAIPVLEGVLSIEENAVVRKEIERTLRKLKAHRETM